MATRRTPGGGKPPWAGGPGGKPKPPGLQALRQSPWLMSSRAVKKHDPLLKNVPRTIISS